MPCRTAKAGVPGTWRTTNISDVADRVKYAIRGTYWRYGIPLAGMVMTVPWLEWRPSQPSCKSRRYTRAVLFPTRLLLGAYIYPDINSLDATVADTVGSRKEYRMHGFEPQFKVGDHVLVHISDAHPSFPDDAIITPQDRALLTPYHNILLAAYGAYHVHGDCIYNVKVPEGAPMSRAINESRSVG